MVSFELFLGNEDGDRRETALNCFFGLCQAGAERGREEREKEGRMNLSGKSESGENRE
jgi:hypothetical protein